jgi:hypothetical protein
MTNSSTDDFLKIADYFDSTHYSGYSFQLIDVVASPNTEVSLSSVNYGGSVLFNSTAEDNVTFTVKGNKGDTSVYKRFAIKISPGIGTGIEPGTIG